MSPVYWIEERESDAPVKIGTSYDPENRLKQGQTWNWRPLQVLGVVPGGRRHEDSIHRRLRDFRVNNEWFHRPAALQALNDLLRYGQLANGDAIDHMRTSTSVPEHELSAHYWIDRSDLEAAFESIDWQNLDVTAERHLLSQPVLFDLDGATPHDCEGPYLMRPGLAGIVSRPLHGGLFGVVWFSDGMHSGEFITDLTERFWFTHDRPDGEQSAARLRLARCALGFLRAAVALLSCSNADIQNQDVLSRPERRSATRHGCPMPQRVVIRQTRSGKPQAGSRDLRAHFVRSHFKHYPVTTRIGARAEKTVVHNGAPHRRVFCRMHVRGEGTPILREWQYRGRAA